MSPLDAFGHLFNLLLPALGVALGSAVAAKLAWRSDLALVPWVRLFAVGVAAGLLSVVVSLVLFGRDGSMAGYALLVASCAVSQWWLAFGPGRR